MKINFKFIFDSKRLIFAGLSGILLTAAFPNLSINLLAWVALVPFFFAIHGTNHYESFFYGMITGTVHYCTLFYWLMHTMQVYGHLHFLIAFLLLLLLGCFLSLYIGFFATAITKVQCHIIVFPIFAAAFWVTLEFIRTFLFTGFPWALLGYTQAKVLVLCQIVDIFGVYGISFGIGLINACIYIIIIYFLRWNWRHQDIQKMHILTITGIAFGFVVFLYFYGVNRIHQLEIALKSCPKITVSYVQGNIDQMMKWKNANQIKTVNKYMRLSQLLKMDDTQLIVWPETAAPFYYGYRKRLTHMVNDHIQKIGTDFIIGSPAFKTENEKILYYNSAYLINANGQAVSRYDKAHLVPFGEYVPLKKILPFVEKMVAGIGDFTPGEIGQTIEWKKYQLGIQICYEIIFPHLSRKMIQNKADFLINITNDAWYGRSSAPYQHFDIAAMRAIENRRSLVRAANTGISGFVDPIGRVTKLSPLFEAAQASNAIYIYPEKSFYTQYGDIFAIACLIFSLIMMIFRMKVSSDQN